MDKLLTSRNGPWIAGGIIGLIAVLLVKFGNPDIPSYTYNQAERNKKTPIPIGTRAILTIPPKLTKKLVELVGFEPTAS